MKVAVFAFSEKARLGQAMQRHGFLVTSKPECVVVYGGDGTILEAEQRFPGVPKLAFKRGKIVKDCHYALDQLDVVLGKVARGKYAIVEFPKVQAEADGKTLEGVNEVQLHNIDARRALRFALKAGTVSLHGIIGDGMVAATAYGSTAYYHTIGGKPFAKGVRVGFNNTEPKHETIPLEKGQKAVVTIERENGMVLADNRPETISVAKGDRIIFKRSNGVTRFVTVR
ncbi:MAG: NAD(+)/NADH kinase [Candidatus Aenigmarchaeota archaeon]|nr:NAD(+)/NADH kinase [Candidatus Aenigmarchaeota archaeon]